jgi:hypothetical protein
VLLFVSGLEKMRLMTCLPDIHHDYRYSFRHSGGLARRSLLASGLTVALGWQQVQAARPEAPGLAATGADGPHKLTLLLRRHPACSASDWLGGLTRLAQQTAQSAAAVPGLLARRLNRALAYQSPIANAAASAFEAADEFVFGSAAELDQFLGSAQFAALTLPADLLDDGQSEAAVGRWVVLHQQSMPARQPVKIITLPRRAAHLDQSQFAHYWIHNHGPLALAHEPTREQRLWRAELSPNVAHAAIRGYAASSFDGVGSIWFRDEAALKAEFRDSYYQQVMAPDEPKFTDPSASRMIPAQELVAWYRR